MGKAESLALMSDWYMDYRQYYRRENRVPSHLVQDFVRPEHGILEVGCTHQFRY